MKSIKTSTPVAAKLAIVLMGAAALVACVGDARASDDFPLAGTFIQNKPCRGDGTDPRPFKVTITADEITHSGGVCSISDKRQDGNRISVRATCRNRSGKVLSGEVTFTIRDEKTVDMIDQDKNYTAVLNRCPR
jgi:hypothetical protein